MSSKLLLAAAAYFHIGRFSLPRSAGHQSKRGLHNPTRNSFAGLRDWPKT